MLCALFVVGLGLVIICRDRPGSLAAVTGATGIPAIACITVMRGLWREKGAMDVLIVMVRHLPPGEAKLALQQYVNQLASRIDSPAPEDRQRQGATRRKSPTNGTPEKASPKH